MLTWSGGAFSATCDADEYAFLLERAGGRQYVAVQVNLDIDVPLAAPTRQSASLKSKLAKTERALIDELGDTVSPSSIWSNGLGQMGFHASGDALKRLSASAIARSFGLDQTRAMRSGIYEGGNRLEAIEAEIDRNGYADVDVALNLDNFEFDIGADGKTVHRSTTAQQAELRAKLPAFLKSLPATAVPDIEQARSRILSTAPNPAATAPVQRLRINRHGLYLLREHGQVRSLELAGGTETQAPRLDPEALETARKYGTADVIIDLQRFSGYSPLKGKLSASAWRSQAASIGRAFDEILGAADSEATRQVNRLDGVASAEVILSKSALEKLYRNTDPRILGISLNRPSVQPALAESTVQMNLPQGWNKGYTGVGQYIAIFDTGIDKAHPFLKTASGLPKVGYEACFGSNTGDGYKSNCPSPNNFGDSPLGKTGSGVPCPYPACWHGTHVAGIAAGKRNWKTPAPENATLTGVAPDANLVSVNIFSTKTVNGVTSALAFEGDLVMAMQGLVAAGQTEITLNLSLGSDDYKSGSSASCDLHNQAITDSVSQLVSMRIPVIAATGNMSRRGAIEWPSCVSKVVKVAYVNDTTGTIEPFSDLADPRNFNGALVLAPGYPILSAKVGGGAMSMEGTSMAAPHVSGLFALIKAAAPGISVADASAWVMANAVVVPSIAGMLGYTLKRVRVPTM